MPIIPHAAWAERDIYLEDPYEDVRFRYSYKDQKVFRKFFNQDFETEIENNNGLYHQAISGGLEINKDIYEDKIPRSDEIYKLELKLSATSDENISELTKARNFALNAHGTQLYGSKPYFVHLEHVQRVLNNFGYSQSLHYKVSAWLHDVLEDSSVKAEEMESQFGKEVLDTVFRLTDEAGSNRKEIKAKTYLKIQGNAAATIVKLCDRVANVEASKNNPKKLAMYKNEHEDFRKALFLPNMANTLWQHLDQLLSKFE